MWLWSQPVADRDSSTDPTLGVSALLRACGAGLRTSQGENGQSRQILDPADRYDGVVAFGCVFRFRAHVRWPGVLVAWCRRRPWLGCSAHNLQENCVFCDGSIVLYSWKLAAACVYDGYFLNKIYRWRHFGQAVAHRSRNRVHWRGQLVLRSFQRCVSCPCHGAVAICQAPPTTWVTHVQPCVLACLKLGV